MDLEITVGFLSDNIAIQRTALRLRVGIASTIGLIGATGVVLVFVLGGSIFTDTLRWLIALGSGTFGSLSSLTLKDIASIREKTTALLFLLDRYRKLKTKGDETTSDEIEELDQQIRQFIDKSLAK